MSSDLTGLLEPVASCAGMRALAWSGDILYASRGYDLMGLQLPGQSPSLTWKAAAKFHPNLWRKLSVRNRLAARLFRDGFHALAVSNHGRLVAAVPGAIVACAENEAEFRVTHSITRGTRPLHISSIPDGALYWGEYFDNPSRDEVHIYGSQDGGEKWDVAYTFPKGAIRHIHNIVHDQWEKCLWVFTGDNGDECRILRASYDFSRVETVLRGKQQVRAVAAIPSEEGLYLSSDTPLETNHIYLLDRQRKLSVLHPISSSSISGCQAAGHLFFSTMIEPSAANPDRHIRLYGGKGREWAELSAWEKDKWPMRFFQFGNALLPDGNNTTKYLAVTTVASENDAMYLYSINSK